MQNPSETSQKVPPRRRPSPAWGCLLGAASAGLAAYAVLFVVHRLFIEGKQNSAPEVASLSDSDLIVAAILFLSPVFGGIAGLIWSVRSRRPLK